MRKPKMFALPFWLLSMALVCACNAQGAFEDAETSNDYMSGNTQQQFDLRHTIPGEPEVDYPIYSEVPSTSFECTGKHEGYYADMETRCQVFRICTHTARSIHGFGFLCPNGTLFSQKNFVCDWYRNVNCDESEQYFSKNSANRIGSSSDMLERVRQMMEYPMKTISQALQQRPVVLQTSHHTLKKQLELAESGLDVSESDAVQESRRDSSQGAYLARKQPVTRAPVESVSQNYNENQQTQLGDVVTQQRKRLQQQRQQQRNETKSQNSNSAELVRSKTQAKQITQVTQVKSASKPEGDDVYVNSLGELSSDPGVSFMHDTAHIIAEAPSDAKSYQKQQNFAEKVNVALNDLSELPADEVIAPDYVKSLRQPNEDLVLAANINNLLEEVADDLDPSISGYQVPAPSKNKSSFRFLSRGFSSQSDRAKRPPYEYAKPKQTASTIRFTPNELPIDDTYKDTKEFIAQKPNANNSSGTVYESSDETIQFTFMTTTPTPIEPAEIRVENEAAAKLDADMAAEIIEPGQGFSSANDYGTTENPTATTTASSNVNPERYYLNSVGTVPLNLDYGFLSPPEPETASDVEASTADEPTLFEFKDFDKVTSPTTEDSELMLHLTQPTKVTDTTTENSIVGQNEENTTAVDVESILVQKILLPPPKPATEHSSTTAIPSEEYADIKTYPPILDEEKLDVENQAAKLLLAGVKLTKHDSSNVEETAQRANGSYSAVLDPTFGDGGALFIYVDDETVSAYANATDADAQQALSSTTTTTTTTTTTAQPLTSTTVLASMSEGGSFQERIRNYRRFANKQRTTAKPIVYEKRAKLTTTETTKSPSTSATTTRSYLKRVAASRLRLSRLGAANNRTAATTTTTVAPVGDDDNSNDDNDIETSETSRNISVRNIDKELGGGGKRYDARGNSYDRDSARKRGTTTTSTTGGPTVADDSSNGAPTRGSARNSVRRFKVNRKASTEPTTIADNQRAVSKPTRSIAKRIRNRFSNFKTQTSATNAVTTKSETSTSTTTSTAAPTTLPEQSAPIGGDANSPNPMPNLDHLLKSITSSVSYSTSSTKNQPHADSLNAPPTSVTYSMSSSSTSSSSSAPNAASSFSDSPSLSSSSSTVTTQDDSTTFLDFDKLTRAIVDDSVLQNFRSQQQSSGLSTAVAYQTAPSAAMSRSLSVDSDVRAIGNSVTQSYNKLPPQAPAQLTPPQRTQQLSQIKNAHVPTSPTPRIVIARAEGQRIAPNSVSSIISSLVMQPTIKPTTNTAYVALDDFLTKKFGQTTTSYTKTNTATKLTTSERNRHQIVQPPQQQYNQKLQSNFQAVAATATTNPAQSQIQQQQKLPAQKQQFSQHFSQQFQQTQQQQKQLQQLAQQQQLEQLQQLQQQQQKIQQQQLIQQQQKQQQQYAQQQLKEQQYFQQFSINARPQVQQQQQQQAPKSIQQQFGGNSIYTAPQQQQQLALQQQKSTSWHHQQQQQQVSQHKQSQQYAQEEQTQSQQQYQPQKSTSTQFYYPQQQQQQQTSPFTSNFFSIFNQRQQPQLPQFPPLGNTAASATFESPTPSQQQFPSAILSNSIVPPEHDKHVNIQLPALTVGLIPAPTALTLTAQRRMDVGAAADVDSSSASKEALGDDGGAYTGVSSYDVPLSSIGRLPNDITHLLRRLRKVK